jgi:Amt family ammonium transporter
MSHRLSADWIRLFAILTVSVLLASPVVGSTAHAQEPSDEPAVTEETTTQVVVDEEAAPEEEENPFEELSSEEQITALKAEADQIREDANILWTCLAAFLVFFMQAGFAMVETGFTRAKNACNIIMKNLCDFSIGTLAFWLVGFGLMFGASSEGPMAGWIGTTNFFFDAGDNGFGWAFLIFQTVFCATAATIVSGAMAERTKFTGYLAYSVGICVIVYPIFGSWAWGSLLDKEVSKGWLEGIGFYDFAGSTVVHSIGGWAALAGTLVLGARLGRYSNGKAMPIPGHNLPLAALGVFILWLGWFGFNPGSTTAVGDSGSGMAYIAVTTNLSAAAGAMGAMLTAWIMFKKPDTSFALNGALAGLVTITAGCNAISPAFSVLAGFLGGVIVVFSCLMFDKLKIDDPVGAVSVHGVCGAWGTLCVGLFGIEMGLFTGNGIGQTVTQLYGIGAGFLWAFPVSFIIFTVIKHTIGLRVTAEEEMEGLDITEHGMLAYPPGFVNDTVGGSPMPGMVGAASTKTAASQVALGT